MLAVDRCVERAFTREVLPESTWPITPTFRFTIVVGAADSGGCAPPPATAGLDAADMCLAPSVRTADALMSAQPILPPVQPLTAHQQQALAGAWPVTAPMPSLALSLGITAEVLAPG